MFSCLFTKLPNPFFSPPQILWESGKCFLTPGQLSVFITGRNLGCFKGTVQSKSTITFENAPQMCDVLVFMAFFLGLGMWLMHLLSTTVEQNPTVKCETRETIYYSYKNSLARGLADTHGSLN